MPQVWAALGLVNAGDEHGILRGPPEALSEFGDTVWLVPGHCDSTVNLHDAWVVRPGGLTRGGAEAIWPVTARGCGV